MEDLPPAEDGSVHDSPIPEALDDPQDPLRPDIEEENDADAPISAPLQDVEVTEDKDELSDDESILSDIDEAQFEDFDPNAVSIEERPIAVDESNIGLIGTHKRKRQEGEGTEGRKKKREGRREKKTRRPRENADEIDGDVERAGKAGRRRRDGEEGGERRKRQATPDDELSPEESELTVS